MVHISLLWGRQLGIFEIGQTLYSSVESIRKLSPSSKASVLLDSASPCENSIVMVVQGSSSLDHFVLRFDPALQLLRSISYSLSATAKGECYELRGTHNASFKHPTSIKDIQSVFGAPVQSLNGPIKDGKWVTSLQYSGACFLFQCYQKQANCTKSRLTEIRVAPGIKSPFSTLSYSVPAALNSLQELQLPQICFVVDKSSRSITGIAISSHELNGSPSHTAEGNVEVVSNPIICSSLQKVVVSFGENCQDVFTKLGAPCSVYYKDYKHWSHLGSLAHYQQANSGGQEVCFNYRQLGIDVVMNTQRNKVCRFVLHSNAPNHFEFCYYSKCFFQLSISRDGLAIGSGTASVSDALLVTPWTNWRIIQSHVESECTQFLRQCHYSPSVNTSYPCQNTSLHTLFHQLIFETTPSDNIAKMTVISPSSDLSILSKSSPIIAVKRVESYCPLDVREVEQTFQVMVKVDVKEEERKDDSDDDELFHSAESSLTRMSSIQSDPVKCSLVSQKLQEEYRTVMIKRKAHFSQNVNLVIDSSMHPSRSSQGNSQSSPNTLLYEFPLNSDEHFSTGEDLQSATTEDRTVLYESESLLLTESCCLAEDEVSPPTELDSFVFVTSNEVSGATDEMQLVTSNEVSGATDEMQLVEADVEPNATSNEPELHSDTTTDNIAEKSPSSSPETPPPIADFHYQPQSATMMTSSRLMAISQDIGLPSKESSRVNVPKSKTKGSKQPSSRSSGSKIKPQTSKQQPRFAESGSGKLIVQRRVGTGVSARQEAQKRLLSHTKSSEQRLKQKYISQKVKSNPDSEEGVEGGDDDESGQPLHDDVENGLNPNLEQIDEVENQTKPNLEAEGGDIMANESSRSPEADRLTPLQVQIPAFDENTEQTTETESESHSVVTNIDFPSAEYSRSQTEITYPLSSESAAGSVIQHGTSSPPPSKHLAESVIESETDDTLLHIPTIAIPTGDSANPQVVLLDSEPLDSLDNPVRKTWAEEPFSPDTGPPSMTRERVLFEQISCEHTELCGILKERKRGLACVRQSLHVSAPGTTAVEDHLAQVHRCDDAFLANLLAALNTKRSIWTLKLTAEILPRVKDLLNPNSSKRHLLTACQSLQIVVEEHSFTFLKYRAGRLTLFSREELTRCGVCCSELEAILEKLDELVPSLQHSPDGGADHLELLTEINSARPGISRILRKMEVE